MKRSVALDVSQNLRIGDFQLFPSQGRLVGPTGEARLQPKIIDVLLVLAETPDEVVPRQAIHDRVWGSLVVTDDALNRCISELRRVFGNASKLIETVPKRGYRLIADIEPLADAAEAISVREPVVARSTPPAKPALATVAVLPFDCATPDSPHAFLADGLALALHSSLTRLDRIRVCSKRLSFNLDDRVRLERSATERLDAQYLISGNLAELGDRIRVIVQVDDADADVVIWSQRFEFGADEALTFEQSLPDAVVGAFGGLRLRAEISRTEQSPPHDLAAWELVQRARSYLLNYSAESLRSGLQLLREAVAREPDYALPHAVLGSVIAELTINALSDDPASDRSEALDAATRALSLSPTDPSVLRSVGSAQAFCGDYESASTTLRRAVSLAPYDLGAWGYLGWPLTASGDGSQLEEWHRVNARLVDLAPTHPGVPFWQYHTSVALACAEEYEKAVEPIERCLASQPKFVLGLMHYANLLGHLGQNELAARKAEAASNENVRMTPSSYATVIAQLTDSDTVRRRRTEGLRSAGL